MNEKKPKQTPTRCQSQDRKQDYLETNKPLRLKKNEMLVSLKQHHNNSFHALLTFHLSFAAKMLMVSQCLWYLHYSITICSWNINISHTSIPGICTCLHLFQLCCFGNTRCLFPLTSQRAARRFISTGSELQWLESYRCDCTRTGSFCAVR